jgi:hypothetical protein
VEFLAQKKHVVFLKKQKEAFFEELEKFETTKTSQIEKKKKNLKFSIDFINSIIIFSTIAKCNIFY